MYISVARPELCNCHKRMCACTGKHDCRPGLAVKPDVFSLGWQSMQYVRCKFAACASLTNSEHDL